MTLRRVAALLRDAPDGPLLIDREGATTPAGTVCGFRSVARHAAPEIPACVVDDAGGWWGVWAVRFPRGSAPVLMLCREEGAA